MELSNNLSSEQVFRIILDTMVAAGSGRVPEDHAFETMHAMFIGSGWWIDVGHINLTLKSLEALGYIEFASGVTTFQTNKEVVIKWKGN